MNVYLSQLTGLLACALLAGSLQAQQTSEVLAKRLIQMRGQVDELQSELNLKREEHKNRMAYLTAQEAEIAASRDRELLRITQLENDLEKMRAEVAAAGDTSEALAPVVQAHLQQLRLQIKSGFPFKISERLNAADDIATQLESGVITAQRAFNRLWALVEDEIRISRENAIFTQSVNLNGDNVLVEVAKLGNAMMFFRTRDLKYGRAVETASGWRFELLASPVDQEQAARLFDSLRKQIRQGYFVLPNALPLSLEASS